jgi:type I restriction enzyme, S subunit
MSKLERMIKELCPNGVEVVELGAISEIYDGTHQTPKYTEEGIKFVSVENINNIYETKKYISYEDFAKYKVKPRINDLLMTRIGTIGVCTVVDREEELAYYVTLALIRPNSSVNTKYLKYAIESKNGRKELRKRTLVNAVPIKINLGDIGKVKIPIPPLPVQEEIVRILDNFTEVTSELTSELTLELKARKQQYEYYRDKLFNLSDDVEWKTLGDIGKVSMCKRIFKDQTQSNGEIPFYKIGTFGKEADAYISQELFEEYKQKYSYPKKGEVLISASGTIGRTVIFDGMPSYFQDSNIVWIANDEKVVLNKFLFHFYKIAKWAVSEGGTISRLYNDNIKKTPIPVPQISNQERIIGILERLETLVNNIIEVLFAEIEARQKQYEYYRDKLLTFKEIEK